MARRIMFVQQKTGCATVGQATNGTRSLGFR